ncbi:F0F1 ATP synthase subunit delta [Subtercola lobariae]|uniref:ATP synthase subunit delta n=1 Tax=Subtercola lobariae TaxID=1588641 RepID=A0A917B7L7_9MICO|nr:F0F1 ATP synthase subunit delta [Subtercola lobariae]GGF25603.1 ATP synthase subunit delta [Subtercola lobariae]
MGSASREALASSKAAIAAVAPGALTLSTGEDLFAAGRIIGASPQFRGLLSDPATEQAEKSALIRRVFGDDLSTDALSLLTTIASATWSSTDDLLSGIEEVALRVIATSAPADLSIESELFEFGEAVSSDSGLELAVSSSFGAPEAKVALINALLHGRASEQTVVIVRHLVLQPRGRRIEELLNTAATIVADTKNQSIATVTSATPIAPAQLDRLRVALGRTYGRELTINQVVDASVLGGLRVQIGGDVIDGSIESRLNDLRQKLTA